MSDLQRDRAVDSSLVAVADHEEVGVKALAGIVGVRRPAFASINPCRSAEALPRRDRTRRVYRWRPGMSARWSAAALLEIEESFRKIMGYRDLWALKAILDGSQPATREAVA
jgi:hypothetical protein